MMYETTRDKNRHRAPKEEQTSYKIKSYSTDISFCAAYECRDTECSRNVRSICYRAMLKYEDGYHSASDFGPHCSDYKGVKF